MLLTSSLEGMPILILLLLFLCISRTESLPTTMSPVARSYLVLGLPTPPPLAAGPTRLYPVISSEITCRCGGGGRCDSVDGDAPPRAPTVGLDAEEAIPPPFSLSSALTRGRWAIISTRLPSLPPSEGPVRQTTSGDPGGVDVACALPLAAAALPLHAEAIDSAACCCCREGDAAAAAARGRGTGFGEVCDAVAGEVGEFVVGLFVEDLWDRLSAGDGVHAMVPGVSAPLTLNGLRIGFLILLGAGDKEKKRWVPARQQKRRERFWVGGESRRKQSGGCLRC